MFNQDWQDRQYYPYTKQLYRDGPLQRLLAQSTFFRANRDLSALFSSARSGPRGVNAVLPAGGGAISTPEGCRRRAKEHSEVKFRETLIRKNSAYLENIVALGIPHDVAIHFLNTPKRDCYRASHSVSTRQTGRNAILKALGSHRANFQDYFEDSRFLEEDFLDADHLSPAGGQKVMNDFAARTPGPAGGPW